MQHRNQSHEGRGSQSGRNGRGGNFRNNNWRSQERDEDGRFVDQRGSEGRSFSRGSNDNWRYEERDDRGRFTDQDYRSSSYADYEDEDGAYGRARN